MTSIVNYKLSTINNIYFLLLLFCTQLIINTFFFLIVRTSLSRTDWGWHSICSRFRCFLIYMHTLTHSTKRMHTQIINSETYPLVIRFLLTLKLSASLSHSASFGIKKKKKWNPRLINTRCSHNWLPLKVFFFISFSKLSSSGVFSQIMPSMSVIKSISRSTCQIITILLVRYKHFRKIFILFVFLFQSHFLVDDKQ